MNRIVFVGGHLSPLDKFIDKLESASLSIGEQNES